MNLFTRIKPVKPLGIMRVNKNFRQEFVSHQEPEFAIGEPLYFIYAPYQKPEAIISGKVIGYKYTFNVDQSGNISGDIEYNCAGDACYYYKNAIDGAYFKSQEDAQKFLDLRIAAKE